MTFSLRLALAATSLLLASACSTLAPGPSPSATPKPAPSAEGTSMDADEALRTLIAAQTFEDVKVSYDGHLSTGVRAFRALFGEPDAAERFRQLFARGTLVGQLYATIGLRHHDPVAYAEAVRTLRARADERVPTLSGCDGGSERIGELLESRTSTAIHLAPGQTYEEWFAIHKTGETDVVGGGFTSQFGQVPSRL